MFCGAETSEYLIVFCELVIDKIRSLGRILLYKHCTTGNWQHSVCENKTQRGRYKFPLGSVFSLVAVHEVFILKNKAWNLNGETSVGQRANLG